MTTTDNHEVEGYFNIKTSRHNIMHTFFYSNICEFDGNLKEMTDEREYKKTIQNMDNIGWK